ncbi:hypothetical protein VPH35_096452 [Triticum aestivum]|uniref:Uncharacterized protein n=1 Tax=Aegilops tauschii TaxID=37682 RepID=M8CLJ3_AEGTA
MGVLGPIHVVGRRCVVPELPDPQSLAAPRAAASPGHLRRTPRPPPPCRDATSAATPGPVATLPGPRRHLHRAAYQATSTASPTFLGCVVRPYLAAAILQPASHRAALL